MRHAAPTWSRGPGPLNSGPSWHQRRFSPTGSYLGLLARAVLSWLTESGASRTSSGQLGGPGSLQPSAGPEDGTTLCGHACLHHLTVAVWECWKRQLWGFLSSHVNSFPCVIRGGCLLGTWVWCEGSVAWLTVGVLGCRGGRLFSLPFFKEKNQKLSSDLCFGMVLIGTWFKRKIQNSFKTWAVAEHCRNTLCVWCVILKQEVPGHAGARCACGSVLPPAAQLPMSDTLVT